MTTYKVTCNQCRFAVNEDYGYSNYTTEGTEFSCAIRLHPAGTFDRFYGENPKLDFAAQCAGFEAGEPLDIDCDHEAIDELTPDQRQIWDMHDKACKGK